MIRKIRNKLINKGLCQFEIESIIDSIKDKIRENGIEDLGYILAEYNIHIMYKGYCEKNIW